MTQSNSGRTVAPTGPVLAVKNTLHLQGQDLDRLHEELDGRVPKSNNVKRAFMRYSYRLPTVRIDIKQSTGAATGLHYATRDLSGTGVSVLHSAYVHVGGPCVVHLPHPVSGITPLEGKIVRCRHVQGSIHDVGIRFTDPIKVRDYLSLDPFEGRFTLEKVDAEKISGGLLHVEDSAMDRKLVRHFLKDTSLNIVSAEDGANGLKRASEGFDLILCDFNMPDMDGAKFVEALRATSVQTPVLIASADTSPVTRDRIRGCRASAFVAKPMTSQSLLRAVAEFLLLGGTGSDGGGVMSSSLPEDDPRMQFVQEFCAEMKKTASVLNKAVEAEDVDGIRRVCFQVKGAAPSMGFDTLAVMAETALKAVDASMSVPESLKPLKTLASACQRIRGVGQRKAG